MRIHYELDVEYNEPDEATDDLDRHLQTMVRLASGPAGYWFDGDRVDDELQLSASPNVRVTVTDVWLVP